MFISQEDWEESFVSKSVNNKDVPRKGRKVIWKRENAVRDYVIKSPENSTNQRLKHVLFDSLEFPHSYSIRL